MMLQVWPACDFRQARRPGPLAPPEAEILTLLALLDRLCAMLTRLAHMGERPSGPAQIGQRERSRER